MATSCKTVFAPKETKKFVGHFPHGREINRASSASMIEASANFFSEVKRRNLIVKQLLPIMGVVYELVA